MNEHHVRPNGALPAAVLWDFDGTMVDTEPIWIGNEYALTAELGGQWTEDLALANVGNSLLKTARAIRTAAGREDLTDEQVRALLLERVTAEVQVAELAWRPGARELLTELSAAGVPCALVSASFREMLQTILERFGFNPFQVVVSGDDVTHGKPHPAPYLTACARLGVAPEDCLVIEDSVTGAASGNAAGCVVAVVPHVVTPPPAERRILLDTLAGVGLADLQELMAGELIR